MSQEVEVKRTLLPSPTPEDPDRKIYQVLYWASGMLPKQIYILEKEWSKDEETKRIKADIKVRQSSKAERIKL
jgi:hypothetical protein